jgi:hypothetical protein
VRFSALYDSISGLGLVCLELILKTYVTIFINLDILQVTQGRVGRFFNWFGCFAFGWFGPNVKFHSFWWLKAHNTTFAYGSQRWWSDPLLCLGID